MLGLDAQIRSSARGRKTQGNSELINRVMRSCTTTESEGADLDSNSSAGVRVAEGRGGGCIIWRPMGSGTVGSVWDSSHC
jgi:hypothetical protein